MSSSSATRAYDRADCIRIIGTRAVALCAQLSSVCAHRKSSQPRGSGGGGSGGGGGGASLDNETLTLLCMATHHAPPAPCPDAAALAAAWFAHTAAEYEARIDAFVRAHAEDAAELRSLFFDGVCAGRTTLNVSEIASLFQAYGDLSGEPALNRVDWAAHAATVAVAGGGGGGGAAVVSAEAAAAVLVRAWADVKIGAAWWDSAAVAAAKATTTTTTIHSVAFSVSPTLRIRFRISFPSVLASQHAAAAVGAVVVRDLTVSFDDDDVVPGASVAPLVKSWRETLGHYGVPESALTKAVLHLQRLVAKSMDGDFLGTAKASAPQSSTGGGAGGGDGLGSPSRMHPHSAHAASAAAQHSQSGKSAAAASDTNIKKSSSDAIKGDIGLLYRDPEAAMRNVDLQDVDMATLDEYKARMDEQFAAKVLRPGQEGYEYDKRVDFKPTEASVWDSDDE